MENASFHKGNDTQDVLIKGGHSLLYLPAYSSNFNPIEKKYPHAKSIKRMVRGTIETLFKLHGL